MKRMRRLSVAAAGLALIAGLVGCSSDPGPSLEITGASVRLPPGSNTAMYFTVTNSGDEADRLVDAACTIADCEVHESYLEDGLMQMRHITGVDVAAGESVAFEPGGLHVMLIGVEALQLGQEVQIDLVFEKTGAITVTAPVAEYGE